MSKKSVTKTTGLEACMILNQRYMSIPKDQRLIESDNALISRDYPIDNSDIKARQNQILLFELS